jgi:hypothetical protein
MVFLGAGLVPPSHSSSPAELSRADKPVVLGPAEYSEAQYRYDRQALSYARRASELNKLRELASAPLANWIAAPTGTETEQTPDIVIMQATVANTPAVEAPANVTEAPATGKSEPAAAPVIEPEPAKPPAVVQTVPVAPARQLYAALNASGKESMQLTDAPQVRFIVPKPKPRAKFIRRGGPSRHVAAKPAPVVQKPPFADFPLLAWLFNFNPQPATPAPTPVPATFRTGPAH